MSLGEGSKEEQGLAPGDGFYVQRVWVFQDHVMAERNVVTVKLEQGVFNFSHAREDGLDIRFFADSDFTRPIPHHCMLFNPQEPEALFAVALPIGVEEFFLVSSPNLPPAVPEPQAIFDFWDDFPGKSFNENSWNAPESDVLPKTVENGVVCFSTSSLNGHNVWSNLSTFQKFQPPFVLDFDVRVGKVSGRETKFTVCGMILRSSQTSGYNSHDGEGNWSWQTWRNGFTVRGQSNVTRDGKWRHVSLHYDNESTSIFEDGQLVVDECPHNPPDEEGVNLTFHLQHLDTGTRVHLELRNVSLVCGTDHIPEAEVGEFEEFVDGSQSAEDMKRFSFLAGHKERAEQEETHSAGAPEGEKSEGSFLAGGKGGESGSEGPTEGEKSEFSFLAGSKDA